VYEHILYDVADRVATLTLNRPEKLNAYTAEMGEELVDAFGRAREDPDVGAVVLAGAGRGFCAGVDLEHLKAQARAQAEEAKAGATKAGAGKGGTAPRSAPRIGEESFVRSFPAELLAFPKPVIAAIHGPAIGVGVTMTLPCDVRLAAEDARLGLTFTKLGLLPGLGSTHLLPRLVGRARALDLVLSARVIEAPEAHAIGLVQRVVPGEDLTAEARELAAAMAEKDPAVLAAAKAALLHGEEASMEEAMGFESRAAARLREARGRAT